jgi:hypothetical protein
LVGCGPSLTEGVLGKFEQINNVINRKFVKLDEELDRVMALVGEKIQAGLDDPSAKFEEVLDAEGERYGVLARDMELVNSRLV